MDGFENIWAPASREDQGAALPCYLGDAEVCAAVEDQVPSAN